MTQNELPVGWVKCKLEDICYLDNGDKVSGVNLPLLDVKYIRGKKEAEYRSAGVILEANDYVILVDGENSGEIFKIKEKGIMGSTFKKISFRTAESIRYALYVIRSCQKLFRENKRGSAIPHLDKKLFKEYPINLPPLAEQKRIVGKIEELFAEVDKGIDLLKQKQAELKKYRQSVLSAAFSGKLYKTTNWQEKSIKDVSLYIQRGKSPQYAALSNYPIINQKCIRWNALETEYLKYLTQSFFSKITTERFVQPNDILWNSTGTGTIGRAYLYKGNEISSPVVVDSHVTIVRANTKEILPIFLYYFIMSPIVQFSIESMQNGSTNQVELAREKIRTTQLNLPSLPEQEQIVAEIEQRFEKTDILEKSIENALESAEKLKQSILKKAFEGKLVPQNPNDEPASVLLERIKSEQPPKKGKRK